MALLDSLYVNQEPCNTNASTPDCILTDYARPGAINRGVCSLYFLAVLLLRLSSNNPRDCSRSNYQITRQSKRIHWTGFFFIGYRLHPRRHSWIVSRRAKRLDITESYRRHEETINDLVRRTWLVESSMSYQRPDLSFETTDGYRSTIAFIPLRPDFTSNASNLVENAVHSTQAEPRNNTSLPVQGLAHSPGH
jgi:hypothetical protein